MCIGVYYTQQYPYTPLPWDSLGFISFGIGIAAIVMVVKHRMSQDNKIYHDKTIYLEKNFSLNYA
jgi:hypothetical protein